MLVSRGLGPLTGLEEEGPPATDTQADQATDTGQAYIDSSALLYTHIPALMFALHLVYEVS